MSNYPFDIFLSLPRFARRKSLSSDDDDGGDNRIPYPKSTFPYDPQELDVTNYKSLILEYYYLAKRPTLENPQADRLAQLLDFAYSDSTFSLLINEVDEALFHAEYTANPAIANHANDQAAIIKEFVLNTDDISPDRTIASDEAISLTQNFLRFYQQANQEYTSLPHNPYDQTFHSGGSSEKLQTRLAENLATTSFQAQSHYDMRSIKFNIHQNSFKKKLQPQPLPHKKKFSFYCLVSLASTFAIAAFFSACDLLNHTNGNVLNLQQANKHIKGSQTITLAALPQPTTDQETSIFMLEQKQMESESKQIKAEQKQIEAEKNNKPADAEQWYNLAQQYKNNAQGYLQKIHSENTKRLVLSSAGTSSY